MPIEATMPEPIIASKQSIEHLFDGAAAVYDRTGPSLFARWGARLVELMAPEPGAYVLDVATGRGAVLLPAAQRVGPSGRVVGIDLSAAMVVPGSAGNRRTPAPSSDARPCRKSHRSDLHLFGSSR